MIPIAAETHPGSSPSRIDARERLIVALDVPTADAAREFVKELDGVVSFYKIGIELFVSSGLTLVPELIRSGNKVFLDLKYFDVPETVKRAVKQIASLGVSFLTIHGNGSIIQAAVEGRQAAVEDKGGSELKLLSVTVLTSLDSEDIRELGFPCSLRELVVYRATKAMQAGCDGVITSPREAEAISDLAQEVQGISPRKFLIVTPGVRPGDSLQNDHKRLDTPAQAIASGADFLVMGRPIRDAADPRQAAAAIIAEMQTAFEKRGQGF